MSRSPAAAEPEPPARSTAGLSTRAPAGAAVRDAPVPSVRAPWLGGIGARAACPFLGYVLERDGRGTAPSDLHRCWRTERPRPIALGHQAEVCLRGRRDLCAWYDEGDDAPFGSIASPAGQASPILRRYTWISPRRRLLAAAVLIGALLVALAESAAPAPLGLAGDGAQGQPIVVRSAASGPAQGAAVGGQQLFADWPARATRP